MEREELKKDVEGIVADIWSEKEEAEVRKKTEEALQKSADVITELTASLEDKNSEVSEITEKLTASDSKIKELETELEAAGEKLKESEKALATSTEVVDGMEKDKAADIRMAELVEAGIAYSDVDAQITKVRDMSEESFASYRDELISLKEAVEERLAKAAEEAKKLKGEEGTVVKDGNDETTVTVPAAEINPGDAIKASLNLETASTKEMSDQYQEMGKTMAALWTKKKE